MFGDITDRDWNYMERMVGGVDVTYVSFNSFRGGGKDRVLKEIAQAKNKGRYVVVYTHWGLEYQKTINQTIQALALSL